MQFLPAGYLSSEHYVLKENSTVAGSLLIDNLSSNFHSLTAKYTCTQDLLSVWPDWCECSTVGLNFTQHQSTGPKLIMFSLTERKLFWTLKNCKSLCSLWMDLTFYPQTSVQQEKNTLFGLYSLLGMQFMKSLNAMADISC